MLLLRIVSQGPSTEKPPRWTMPCTPATARSTSAIEARSALMKVSSAARSLGGLMSLKRRFGYTPLRSLRSRVPMSPAAPVTRTVCIMLQLPILCAVTRVAERRRECLIALAAVEEMPPHGGTSLRDCAAANGVYDRAMFLLEYLAVDAPWEAGAARYGLTRNDEAPEMFQEAPELRIVGSIRDAAMKRKILIDRVLAPFERAIDRVKAIDDRADLGRRGALGGEASSFDFDAGAQLHDL